MPDPSTATGRVERYCTSTHDDWEAWTDAVVGPGGRMLNKPDLDCVQLVLSARAFGDQERGAHNYLVVERWPHVLGGAPYTRLLALRRDPVPYPEQADEVRRFCLSIPGVDCEAWVDVPASVGIRDGTESERMYLRSWARDIVGTPRWKEPIHVQDASHVRDGPVDPMPESDKARWLGGYAGVTAP